MTKITLILALVLVTACGPQLTAKEKEDLQNNANREADIESLDVFRGEFEGKATMRNSGRIINGRITMKLVPSPSDKSKALVLAQVSIWEKPGDTLIFNLDATYISTEKVGDTLYMINQGATGGIGGGAINGVAEVSLTKDGVTLTSTLFTISAKRMKDSRKK